MQWSEQLFLGESVIKNKDKIIRRINKGKSCQDIYVVCLSYHQGELFDIYHAQTLLEPFYKDKNLHALGLAQGKAEALQVLEALVAFIYDQTSGFDMKSYVKTQMT